MQICGVGTMEEWWSHIIRVWWCWAPMKLPGFGKQERAGVLWELSSRVPVCYLFLISEKRSCSSPKSLVFPTLGCCRHTLGYTTVPAAPLLCPSQRWSWAEPGAAAWLGHPSFLPAFPFKQLWQVQTISDGKGMNPGLEWNTSSLWQLQTSGVVLGTAGELPTPRWRRSSPHLPPRSSCPSSRRSWLGRQNVCSLIPSSHPGTPHPFQHPLPFPGNPQLEQLKPAGITNWCLEATFAGGDVYWAAQRDSAPLAGVLCRDNKLTSGACVYLKGFWWEKEQNTCPSEKMQTLPSEESFGVDSLKQFLE